MVSIGTEQRERELSIEHGKSAVIWLEVNNAVRMNMVRGVIFTLVFKKVKGIPCGYWFELGYGRECRAAMGHSVVVP